LRFRKKRWVSSGIVLPHVLGHFFGTSSPTIFSSSQNRLHRQSHPGRQISVRHSGNTVLRRMFRSAIYRIVITIGQAPRFFRSTRRDCARGHKPTLSRRLTVATLGSRRRSTAIRHTVYAEKRDANRK
jgi:hypothetical protein